MKCWLIVLLLSSVAAAETSPQDAAAGFITAIDHGDVNATVDAIEHTSDQQAAATALAKNLIATRRLAAALHDRFGQTADSLGLHALPTTQAVREANLASDESHATLQTGSTSLPMRKIDDTWKLHLLEPGAMTTQSLWLTNHLAAATNECADEVTANKYATLEEAKHAMQLKLGAVVTKIMVNDSVTTRPTTMP